jgi:hypothetical protein
VARHLLGTPHDVSSPCALSPVRDRIGWLPVMSGSSPGFSLSDGWDLSGLSLNELWLSYVALGGSASPARVAAYARGRLRPDSYQHNMIAQAINEYFTGRGEDHPVSYMDIPLLS